MITKGQLMQELWKMSDESDNPKDKELLEIAGNLVEATFDTDSIEESIKKAIDAKSKG